MVMTLSLIATLLGAGMVSLAYLIAGQYWISGLILVLYVIIAFLAARQINWVSTPSLYLVVGLAALGLFKDLEPVLLYSGAILSLAGWDLADFSSRLRLIGQENHSQELQKHHITRLGMVLAIGICIVLVSINLRLKVAFVWLSIFAILSTIGLGRLINFLLKRE